MLAALEHRVAAGVVRRRPRVAHPPRAAAPADRVGRRPSGRRARPRRRRRGRPRPRRRGGGLAWCRAGRPGLRPRAVVEGGGRHDGSGAVGPSGSRCRDRGVRPRGRGGGAPLARCVPGLPPGRRPSCRSPPTPSRPGFCLWLERRTADGRAVAMRGVERGRRAVADPGAAGSVPPVVRTAYVDALIAAWEGAIQAEDVDSIVSLADESLEASRELGLREVLDARTMVGLALEYGATPQAAAAIYRQVWDEAWQAVLPIEAIDAGYRLALALLDGLELDDARRIAAEAERLRCAGRRPRPRPRPDPAGEVPGRDGDVRLAGRCRRDPGGGRGRARSALPLRASPARGRLAGPGRRRRRGRRSATRRLDGRWWPRRDVPAAAGTWSCLPPRSSCASVDGRMDSRRSPAGTRRSVSRTSRRSGCDAVSTRCSRSTTGSTGQTSASWGCVIRPMPRDSPSTPCGPSSTSDAA